jgi:flagellin-like protein
VKSRKAITPILATLLLIVIAVAAIVVTYAWIMMYMSNAANQAGVNLNEVNIRFYGATNNQIDITVQNKGTSDAHIIQIYAGMSPSTLQNQNSSSLPTLCKAGGEVTTITIDYNWTTGTTYYFKVVASEQIAGPWAEQAKVP